MSSYKIVTDTACDIPLSHLEKEGVAYVPFSVSFDSENYYRDLVDLTTNDFYEKLSDATAFPKTSQPTIQSYLDVFEPIAQTGTDILCICLSSKLSGSYQSAVNAKNIVEDSNENVRVHIIDSLCVTGSQNILVLQAIEMQKAGLSLDDVVAKLDALKPTGKIFFTVDSLEHLQKGGRIGKAASLAGSILNIKPILSISDGEIIPVGRVRGQKKSIQHILNSLEKNISDNKSDYVVNSLYGSSDYSNTSTDLVQVLIDGGYDISVMPTAQVGVTIGSHTGPTAVGVCMMKKWECV